MKKILNRSAFAQLTTGPRASARPNARSAATPKSPIAGGLARVLLLLCLLPLPHLTRAQVQYIDLTTLSTNTTSSAAVITIPGVCTDAPYSVLNTNNRITGDPLPTAFAKINASFSYISNELILLLQLPNQYNTNLDAKLLIQGGTNDWISARIDSWLVYSGSLSNQTRQTGMDLTNLLTTLGNDTTNSATRASTGLTNLAWQVGLDLTNLLSQVGTDLTNRVTDIKRPGSSGSATVLKVESPSGASWYLHIDNTGTLTITSSP